jgi:prophage regulatory protein
MREKPAKRILRLPAVEDRTGLKRSQIHFLESKGKFPKRIKISDRASGWLEHEIDAWIDMKITASRGSPASMC